MTSQTATLALCSVSLVLLSAIGLTILLYRGISSQAKGNWGRSHAVVLVVGAVAAAVLFLRPHEHTFQGLDCSALRLMSEALGQGRPLLGVDATLSEVPEEIREGFLYRPLHPGAHTTRDRAFEIDSLKSCETRPFFYPSLPLAMRGFDAIVPGPAQDYLVPLLGTLLAVCLAALGIHRGGHWGAAASTAFLAGTPITVWVLRGAFPEAVGTVLICLVVLHFTLGGRVGLPASLLPPFALGLAVSFHPVLLVLSLPLLGLLGLTGRGGAGSFVLSCVAFGLGALPLALMTLFVTAPYFALSRDSLAFAFTASASIRSTLVASAAAAALLAVMMIFKARVTTFSEGAAGRFPRSAAAFLLLSWTLPLASALLLWGERGAVLRGLTEMWGSARGPAAGGMLLLAAALLAKKGHFREKLVVSVVSFTLPVFLYLKGGEIAGEIWTVRRIFPPWAVMIAAVVPAGSGLLARYVGAGRGALLRTAAVAVALLGAGLYSPLRWPAPYLVRFEKGGGDLVRTVRRQWVGGSLLIFDYYPHSVPFAASPGSRVLGVGEEAFGRLEDIAGWAAGRAQKERVYWVSAYASPGLERGVRLLPEGREESRLPRVRTNRMLPAERSVKTVVMEFLRAVPLSPGEDPPVLHKVFDGGPLGLRPPWGRGDIPIVTAAGSRLPAQWSRDGSGIVGPVPPPGSSVRITLEAAVPHPGSGDGQVLAIHPPWESPPLEIGVGREYGAVTALLRRGGEAKGPEGRTGTYRFTAARPYDPAALGIGGFDHDLGALIHSIRMEIVDDGRQPD